MLFPSKSKRGINLGNKRPLRAGQTLRNAEKLREERQAQRHESEMACAVQNKFRSLKLVREARFEYAAYLIADPARLTSCWQLCWVLPVFKDLEDADRRELVTHLAKSVETNKEGADELLHRFPKLWDYETVHKDELGVYSREMEKVWHLQTEYTTLFTSIRPANIATYLFDLLPNCEFNTQVLTSICSYSSEYTNQFLETVLTDSTKPVNLPPPLLEKIQFIESLDFIQKPLIPKNVETLVLDLFDNTSVSDSWALLACLIAELDAPIPGWIAYGSMLEMASPQMFVKIWQLSLNLLVRYIESICKSENPQRVFFVLAHTSNNNKSLVKTLWEEHQSSNNEVYLPVALEILTFWMPITTDLDLVDHTLIQFSQQDFVKLTMELKQYCINVLWLKPQSSEETFLSRKEWLPIALLKFLYLFDSRQHFMPPNFWTADELVTEMYLKSPAIIDQVWQTMFVQSYDSSIDTDGVLDGQNMSTNTKACLLDKLPLLRVLKNAPFLIDFKLRALIFHLVLVRDHQEFQRMNSEPLIFPREDLLQAARAHFQALGARVKNQPRVIFSKNGVLEEGVDGGGLTRELLSTVVKKAFINENADGSVSGVEYNGQPLFVENEYHLLVPNATITDAGKEHRMRIQLAIDYFFLGQLIGKCVYEGVLLNFEFAPEVLVQPWLLWFMPLDILESADPVLYTSLKQLLSLPENEVDNLGLDFTTQGSSNELVELTEGGSEMAVTGENRRQYVLKLAYYKAVARVRKQSGWLFSGLLEVINFKCLNMFTVSELSTVISGTGKGIDIADLKQNTEVSGFSNPEFMNTFWSVLEEFTPEQHSRFLKFVTALERGPLLGFKMLDPRIGIRCSGFNDSQLPTSSTCVNLLRVPEYTSRQILRERLLSIVDAEHGFDLQ